MRFYLILALGLLAGAGCKTRQPNLPDRATPFFVAQPEEQLAAIGPTGALSFELQRAFEKTDAFDSMRPPRPGEWLAEFDETPQSWSDWYASRPNLPNDTRGVIYVQPIGAFEPQRSPSLEVLKDHTTAFFGLKTVVLPPVTVAKVGARERVNPGTDRKQLLTSDILEWLSYRKPADAYCVIAVTMTDLFPKDSWNFVFGQATFKARVGVFSFARMVPGFPDSATPFDRPTTISRSMRVMAHEIGHMFGISHCTHFMCVMNGSNSLAESDRQPHHVCPVCLRKLHSAARFDVVARYERLKAIYTANGIDDEATWVEARISAIKTGPEPPRPASP